MQIFIPMQTRRAALLQYRKVAHCLAGSADGAILMPQCICIMRPDQAREASGVSMEVSESMGTCHEWRNMQEHLVPDTILGSKG